MRLKVSLSLGLAARSLRNYRIRHNEIGMEIGPAAGPDPRTRAAPALPVGRFLRLRVRDSSCRAHARHAGGRTRDGTVGYELLASCEL